jgi:two-component system response regulator YesN
MIVDDMEVIRRDVKQLNVWGRTSGFIITEEAEDGVDALRKLEGSPVDLVITDIRMPNMGGIELLRNISEKKLCSFTVLLSDYTQYDYARQGFLYGAFDYLEKPVEEEELSKLLARIRQKLNERLQEEQKLKALQGFAKDVILTAADTEQVILLIKGGDPNAVAFTSNLIDTIGMSFQYDRVKTLLVLKNSIHEIIDEILQAHNWIELFLDVESLKPGDYTNCKDQIELKTLVLEELEKLITIVRRFLGCHSNSIVRQACEYVLKHIDEQVSVRILSEKLFISKSYLSEVFKQELGMTLLEYIHIVKMERAKRLLQGGNLKNYEIAEILGFKDHEYFSRLFKKYVGALPKDFRNEHLSESLLEF